MRRFVIIGQTALASGDFRLDDLPGSSGRLDALLRCLRAAFLTSHGLRRGVEVYLVLRGGGAPRTLRVTSERVKFLRPDERSLALLVQKALRAAPAEPSSRFVEVRPGVDVRQTDLEPLLAELGAAPRYWLREAASDLRGATPLADDAWFFVGDHLGFDDSTTARLRALDCRAVSVGPLSLHAEDVLTLVHNELDRLFSGGVA